MDAGKFHDRPTRRHLGARSLALTALLALSLFATVTHAIEEPKYTVVRHDAGFEIREYAPYLVAEVLVPGPAERAGNQGFRILAGYIFGKNTGERRIAMTAPVIQTRAPTKIPMTAPVMQTAVHGEFLVQFTMPGNYTLASLPEPTDPRVALRQVPGGRYAVIRYSGTWSERNYQRHLEELEREVQAAGLRTTGAPIYARYNPPFVPWFMRRNEIWLKLP
jgi:hypothetical protein